MYWKLQTLLTEDQGIFTSLKEYRSFKDSDIQETPNDQ